MGTAESVRKRLFQMEKKIKPDTVFGIMFEYPDGTFAIQTPDGPSVERYDSEAAAETAICELYQPTDIAKCTFIKCDTDDMEL